jgi:hypothetical protein
MGCNAARTIHKIHKFFERRLPASTFEPAAESDMNRWRELALVIYLRSPFIQS